MICISCDKVHSEKFCPHCGEKSGVRKITVSSISADVFSSLTNMDKGFLFNLKALFLQPQKITADYISGKRKGILNPVSYLILSITIYLIIINFFAEAREPNDIPHVSPTRLGQIGYEAGKFVRGNIKYFWILSIVPLALSLKLIFRKYNYLEHLAISSFVIGQATLVGLISFLLFRLPLILDPIIYLVIYWLLYRLFKEYHSRIDSFLLSSATLMVFVFELFIIFIIIGILIS